MLQVWINDASLQEQFSWQGLELSCETKTKTACANHAEVHRKAQKCVTCRWERRIDLRLIVVYIPAGAWSLMVLSVGAAANFAAWGLRTCGALWIPDCKKCDRGFCRPDMGCLDPGVRRKVKGKNHIYDVVWVKQWLWLRPRQTNTFFLKPQILI